MQGLGNHLVMVSHLWARLASLCRPTNAAINREVDVKPSTVLWALLALGGIALAVFATDSVLNILGILLGLIGIIGFLL